MRRIAPSMLLVACAAEPPAPADTGLTACSAVLDSHVMWAVQVTPLEDTCGADLAAWQTVYGLRHSGVGFDLVGCDGLEAAGAIGGCQWDYTADEHTERGELPAGGVWSLEATGYAWEEPVDYCALPAGLDWETEEDWTLEEPGGTGLAEGCRLTLSVTGSLFTSR